MPRFCPGTPIARWSARHPRLALTIGWLGCALLALNLLDLHIETRVTALLPHDTPALQRFHTSHEAFGASDLLFVMVEAPENAPVPIESISDPSEETRRDAEATKAAMRAVVDDIVTEVMGDPEAGTTPWTWTTPDGRTEQMVSQIQGHPDPETSRAVVDLLAARAWLLLDDDGLETMARFLEPRRVAKKLANPSVTSNNLDVNRLGERIRRHDPLGMWSHLYRPIHDRLTADQGGLRHRGGYLETPSGRHLVLNLQCVRPAQDIDFTREIVGRMQRLQERFAGRIDERGRPITVHTAGTYMVAHADFQTARSSGVTTLSTSLVGILLLFAVAYRTLRLALLILACLAPAVVASLGLAAVAMGGSLSMIVTAFAAILLGLGVDFLIHIHNAFGWALNEERCGPQEGERARRAAAAVHACERTGPGIVAGAVTTVGTFLVLTFSNYRGLHELGVVCGLGLLVILLQVFLTVPAFLTLWGASRPHTSHLLRGYGDRLLRNPVKWSVGLLLLLAACLVFIFTRDPIMRYERDPYKLRPEKDPVFAQVVELGSASKLRTSQHSLLITAQSEPAVLEAAKEMSLRVAALDEPIELTLSEDCDLRNPEAVLRIAGLDALIAEERARLRAFYAESGTVVGEGDRRVRPPVRILGRMEVETPAGPLLFRERVPDGLTGLLPRRGAQMPQATLPAGTRIALRPFVLPGHNALAQLPAPSRQLAVLQRMALDRDGQRLLLFLRRSGQAPARTIADALRPAGLIGPGPLAPAAAIAAAAALQAPEAELLALERRAPEDPRKLPRTFDWPGIERVYAEQDPAARELFRPFIEDVRDMARRVHERQPFLPSELFETPLAPLAATVIDRGEQRILLRYPLAFRSYRIRYTQPEIFEALQLGGYDGQGDSSFTTPQGATVGSAGFPSIVHYMQDSLIRDLRRLTGLAIIVTGAVLLMMTQSIRDAARSVTSLLAGLTVAMVVLQLFGHSWDMMNIAVLPLIIGIGIDNGIHFCSAMRHHERSPSGVIRTVTEVGHPILMTSLTTIVGFGSLMLNAYRGIQGVGRTAVVGVAACLIIGLIALPLLALIGTHPSRRTIKARLIQRQRERENAKTKRMPLIGDEGD